MPDLIRLTAALLVLAAPVTLRYHYKSGQVLRYRVTEHAETSVQVGAQRGGVVEKQDTATTIERRVLSVSGGVGVVEEQRLEGEMKTTRPQGVTTTVMEPSVRVTTLSPLGAVVKMERRALPGHRDRGPQFLDGLAFTLPSKPVALNATWKGVSNTIGPDKKPLQVRFTSRYAGNVSRGGHPCAQIVTDLSGRFKLTAADPVGQIDGAVMGKVTSYLARDMGQEAAIDGQLTVVYKGTVKINDKMEPMTRTFRVTFSQTLIK